MSTKLRDLIRNIRACKTAAEERALIKKEQALIRESFSANESEYRPRNVAKLLFISMLGYETDFAQMECLHLITANTYNEKRIGYLALTQLFNEKSEVLMMATNRIRIDLNNPSNYIVSLALMALSEVCTSEMCRALSGEVLKLLQNGTAYIKKKAALASTRIVTRVPEKIDEFSQKVELLLEDRHHGVLVASLQLTQHILLIQPDQKQRFQKFVCPMVRIFKSIYSTYSAEYDLGGVSDPFLQIEILKYFRIMCQGNVQLSGEISDILTQVAANTSSAKNSGNAVLYECVKTIFGIESSSTLKTLGINILGKFLQNKDANSKYISLYMLQKVLKHDFQAVQKHKQTILECLKENDNSIKTLALDLLYVITNETNVKGIVKELLNVLLSLTEEDADFTKELTNKLCQIVEKYAPSRRWYIDTFIKILILAGNYVQEDSSSSLIHLIIGTPELQSYAIHKLFFSLQENLNQEGLARTTAYCIGDFGHLLLKGDATTAVDNTPIQITEEEILDLLQKLIEKPNQKNVIKEYVLSALIKLYPKISNSKQLIAKLIQSQLNSTSIEVSKRASEYYGLLDLQWDQHRAGICEQIPPSDSHKTIYENKPIGDVEYDEYPPAKTELEQAKPVSNNESTRMYGFDIDNLIGNQDQNSTKQKQTQNTNQLPGDLFDPFDITLNLTGTQAQSQPISQNFSSLTGIGEFQIKQETQQQQTQQPINPLQNLYNQNINLHQQQQFPFQQQQQQQQQQHIVNLPGDIFDLNLQPLQQKPLPQTLPNIMQQQQQQQFLQQQPITQPIIQPQQQQQQQQQVVQPQQNEQKSLTQQAIAFDDGALQIEFRAVKETFDQTNITAYFNNKTASPITELQLSFAVLKYMKLQLTQPTQSTISGNSTGQVISTLKITNSNQGQKGIVMKIKVSYKINGLIIDKEVTFNKFPPEY